MATDASSDSSKPDDLALSVAGVRLVDLVDRPGPFATLFVGPGSGLQGRAHIAINTVPVPAPHAGKLIEAIEDAQARSQVVVSDGQDVWRFLLEDPLAIDLARFGDVPSLGPVIEAAQVTCPHVVVTIEDDVYGITNFSAIDHGPVPAGEPAPLTEPTILEAQDHLVDALRSTDTRLVALMGSEAAISEIEEHLRTELPLMRYNAYPTNDIDRDLLSIADEIVRDAASLAAEDRTHDLAHFRQSRMAAQAQEGEAVLGALEAGGVQRLLVHDDLDIEQASGVNRMADRAIVAALRAGVPITMIPHVPDERGPREGLGAIMKGHGTAVPSTSPEPQSVEDLRLTV